MIRTLFGSKPSKNNIEPDQNVSCSYKNHGSGLTPSAQNIKK